MADEKTTPTPKAPGAKTDTMHSTPDTPDRARGEGDQSGVADRNAVAAPSAGGSAGSERPGKEVIATENAGTLVTDLPNMDEDAAEADAVNPGQEAPDVVGRQPNENREEAKARIAEASAARDERKEDREERKAARKDK